MALPHRPAGTTPAQRFAAMAAIGAFIATVIVSAFVMAYAGHFVADGTAPITDPRYVLYVLTAYPHSMFSFATLSLGLAISVGYLSTRGGRMIARARPWRMLRIVFSPRYLRHRSHVLDIIFFIANAKAFVLLFGWLILSGALFSTLGYTALVGTVGLPERTALPPWLIAWIGAVALYLAYEFGYYVDHYLSHRVPFLWEFHRVHHEAEVLSPLTTFRVHPIDTVVFYNILSITAGLTNAVVHFGFGLKLGEANIVATGLFLGVFSYLFLQLHHTQLWIPFTGWLGRIFISPAHHQIHHSANPAHFDRNMGSCLAVFDWMFGTLHIPSRQRERLTFGVPPAPHEVLHDPQSVEGALLTPFKRGYGVVADALVGASGATESPVVATTPSAT